jgi:hypothetical protein
LQGDHSFRAWCADTCPGPRVAHTFPVRAHPIHITHCTALLYVPCGQAHLESERNRLRALVAERVAAAQRAAADVAALTEVHEGKQQVTTTAAGGSSKDIAGTSDAADDDFFLSDGDDELAGTADESDGKGKAGGAAPTLAAAVATAGKLKRQAQALHSDNGGRRASKVAKKAVSVRPAPGINSSSPSAPNGSGSEGEENEAQVDEAPAPGGSSKRRRRRRRKPAGGAATAGAAAD